MHRLAFYLGKTVHELTHTIGGVREVISWMAYLQLEPPEKVRWEQAAMQCLTAVRIAGDSKSKLTTFMPDYSDPQTVEDQKLALRAAFMMGKTDG